MTRSATVISLENDADIRLEVGPWGTRVLIHAPGAVHLTLDFQDLAKAREMAVACQDAYDSGHAEKQARVGMIRRAVLEGVEGAA